jgi:hypothetical protein
MAYSNLTTQHPSALKRFSHTQRFQRALALLDVHDGESVLDYGTGDGYFLQLLRCQYPHCDLWGYEPDPMMAQGIQSQGMRVALSKLEPGHIGELPVEGAAHGVD